MDGSKAPSIKHRYSFYKEGRYLFYELLRIINNKIIPHTWKGNNVLTSFDLDKLLFDLYKVYHEKEFNNDSLERWLFLVNAEDIFEITLVKNIFDSYNSFFQEHKRTITHGEFLTDKKYIKPAKYMGANEFTKADLNLLLGLKASFFLMNDLKECPLTTIKLKTWKTYINRYYELGREYAQYANLSIQFDLIKHPLPEEPSVIASISQDMADCFFYVLMKIYRCFSEKEDSGTDSPSRSYHAMNTLKKKILEYLTNNTKTAMCWSLLESDDPKEIKIPSLPHEYFDHQIAYMFYLSPDTNPNAYVESMYESNEITQYLKYILTRKKLSKEQTDEYNIHNLW